MKQINNNINNTILKSFGVEEGDNELQKSKGEGSRGGKITGHTKSGKAIYNKLDFKYFLMKRKKDPENIDHHDRIKRYLNKIKNGAGDNFSEEFDPQEHSVEDGHRMAKQYLSDAEDMQLEKSQHKTHKYLKIENGKYIYDYDSMSVDDHKDAAKANKRQHENYKGMLRSPGSSESKHRDEMTEHFKNETEKHEKLAKEKSEKKEKEHYGADPTKLSDKELKQKFDMYNKASKNSGFNEHGKKLLEKYSNEIKAREGSGSILKKYNKHTEINDHGAAAKLLVDEFGTDEEKNTVNEINQRHKKAGSISEGDLATRNKIANKYYKKLKGDK